MKNNFFYNFSLGNINAKPSNNSETLSQILYGEKFKVLKNYEFRVGLLGGTGTSFQIADGIHDLAFKS